MSPAERTLPDRNKVSRFARDLRRRRKSLRLTQADLARSLGVQTQTISQWERTDKKPQPRFYDNLVGFLELDDKAELRERFDQMVEPDGERQQLPQSPGRKVDRLTLVPAAAQMTDRNGDANLDGDDPSIFDHDHTPGRELEPRPRALNATGNILDSALTIIKARDGRLSQTEAEIVKALIACHRELNGH